MKPHKEISRENPMNDLFVYFRYIEIEKKDIGKYCLFHAVTVIDISMEI
jgi:hypothetical protein